MTLTPRELAKRDEFDAAYRQGCLQAMLAVEREVCGCDYGATSWASKDEVDLIANMLGLRPDLRLLEIGAGSGWPALYLAEKSGCDVVLADLPFDGLHIAAKRAGADGLSGACFAAVADAAQLPFGRHAFDAINHSDVLCCLVRKREVLQECRRAIRPSGAMTFSVIRVAEGLAAKDHALAVETSPEFVETEVGYPTLLAETGWVVFSRRDLTAVFVQSCVARLRVEEERREALLPVVGFAEFERRRTVMSRRIVALEKGLLKRELFFAAPADAPLSSPTDVMMA